MNESLQNNSWHDVYASGPLKARRLRKHSEKLKAMGVLDFPKDAKILDVACGAGEMLEILSNEGFTDLTGLDVYEDTGEQRSWKYIQGSATGLPFPENSFDLIICAHALHHLNSAQEVKTLITQADACLRHGAKMMIIDHYDSMQLRLSFLLLRSPLALLTSWSRDFRKQLILEHEVLYNYLNSYKEIDQIIQKAPFKNKTYKKSLFFFSFTGEKA